MSLKTYLKNLEKKKIISKKPHPIIPILLALIIFILYLINPINNKVMEIALKSLLIFTIIFALIHLIITKILKTK